jgi:hypothetical protein
MKITELLLEYDRAITAKNLGKQLVQALAYDRGVLPDNAGTHIRTYRNHLRQYTKEILQNILSSDEPAMIETVKNIVNSVLEAIEEKDPTPNKQYTQWLARMYSKGGLKIEDLNRANLLGLYDTAKKRRLIGADHADINKFKTYKDFEDTILQYNLADRLRAADEKRGANRGRAKEVYNDSSVRIIVPEDQEAACYYGQGTRWCTAATQGNNYFNQYNRSGPLYIMLPKQPMHEGEKYQLHFGSSQFMDEHDDSVELVDILTRRFPDTLEFFKEKEPELKNLIIFAPDETLKKLTEEIKTLADEEAWDIINNWQVEDDGYYNWLKELGYTDEDGEVDWDRANEDGNGYLEWNYDANDWLIILNDALVTNPNEIRSLSFDYMNDHMSDEYPSIVDLPTIIAYNIRNMFYKPRSRRIDESHGMADFVQDVIEVKKKDGEWTARNKYHI